MQATAGHRATQILRGLVIADVVITIVSAVAVFVDPQILPADLKKYAVDLAETGRFGAGFLAVVAAVSLVADVGLWMLKNWARVLYTAMIILPLAINLLSPEPEVQSPYSSLLSEVASMLEGAILLLIWAFMNDQFRSGGATA